jgi:altronate dehydratase
VRALEWEMNGVAGAYENVDGIVAVAHTEGGEGRTPNNLDLLLRTLSGFVVHPNVGAVLALDHGGEEAVTNESSARTPRSTATSWRTCRASS